MFSPLNKLFIFDSNDCSLVKMTSCCFNINLVLYLCAAVVLESIITLAANYLRIKILLGRLFGSSTSSYLCFLCSKNILLRSIPHPSSICFSFNHNISSLSALFLHHFFVSFSVYISYIFKLYSTEAFPEVFISSFISLYSLNKLFTETNSSQLIYESIKALGITRFIVFKLSFPSNTILSCFFFFFLIIDSYFLIPEVITQIFTFATLTAVLINEVNEQIETKPVTVEAKISKCSTQFKFLHVFLCFSFINSLCFISSKK